MKKLPYESGAGVAFMLLPHPVIAAPLEHVQALVGEAPAYIFILFAIVVAALVYFSRSREDKRAVPLHRVFDAREAVHSVGPDATVMACARTMAAEKIGALLIMDGDRLIGIFTERDALNKVLAPGLDPCSTKVREVMTRNPYCVPPTMTIADAMQVVTKGRFRHLPVMEHDKVLAVVSSGDLTHWLVKDQAGEVQELVDLAARHS